MPLQIQYLTLKPQSLSVALLGRNAMKQVNKLGKSLIHNLGLKGTVIQKGDLMPMVNLTQRVDLTQMVGLMQKMGKRKMRIVQNKKKDMMLCHLQ